jgi:hypothetical protein
MEETLQPTSAAPPCFFAGETARVNVEQVTSIAFESADSIIYTVDAPVLAVAKRLPQHVVQHAQTSDDCIICLESITAGDYVATMPVCGHTFHLQCSAVWLATKLKAGQSATCPICNEEIFKPLRAPQPVLEHQVMHLAETPDPRDYNHYANRIVFFAFICILTGFLGVYIPVLISLILSS